MKTLLEAVNDILITSGERQVSGIGSYPSIKAERALRSSLTDISILQDWVWLMRATPALSWDADIATLPPMQRLLSVTIPDLWRQRKPLREVSPKLYDWHTAQPGRPEEYLLVDSNRVRLNPYPTDIDTQQSIIFHYVAQPQFPVSQDSTLPIPEDLYELLKRGALYHFTQAHLDDLNLAQSYKAQFDEMAGRIVLRQPPRPISGAGNMYRRRGN
jgi:hypothetical protein